MLQPISPTQPLVYTIQEAADQLGYAESTLRVYINRGLLFAEKHGRDWFISHDNLVRFERIHGPKRAYKKSRKTLDKQPIECYDSVTLQG